MLFDEFRQQLPTEVKNVANALTDSSFVATLRSTFEAANTAYARSAAHVMRSPFGTALTARTPPERWRQC